MSHCMCCIMRTTLLLCLSCVLTLLLVPTPSNSLSLKPPSPSHVTTTATNTNTKPQAIIIGAGPVGIATALVLASPRHNYNVLLLESSPETTSQSKYDPTKAFLYNVNSRGQELTRQFPNMQRKLEERSVASKGVTNTTITIVPANPEEDIPGKEGAMVGVSNGVSDDDNDDDDDDQTKEKDGTTNNASSGNNNGMQSEKAVGVGYWIPRHEMVKLMVECMEEHNEKGDGGKITFLTGQECISVMPVKRTDNIVDHDAGGISVTTTTAATNGDSNKTQQQYYATLVIGADGMNSKVRECLASQSTKTSSSLSSSSWSNKSPSPKKFQLKKYTSPASHLRIKVLQLPPQFEIPNAHGKPPLKTTGEDLYAIRSINTGPRNYLSLRLLPMRDNTAVRPTNIVTRPDHEVWNIRNGNAMREYFQKSFPRMNFSNDVGGGGGLISSQEWDRFAKAEGTRFPFCQYSEGMAAWDEDGTSGVALVGDAIHAFPPDIGQGVNAGLMDVVCLDRALCGLDTVTGKEISTAAAATATATRGNHSQKEPPVLQSNLARYQKQHAPEIAALIRVARFGSPYQYKQPHRIDRLRRNLWLANVAFRLLLNKMTFGLIQKPCIMLTQMPELTFRQVMRRADLTTALFKAIIVGVLGVWIRQRFGFGFLSMGLK